jgi:hypothetical protein
MGEPDQPAQNGHDQANVQMFQALTVRRDQLGSANRRADEDRARADRAGQRADEAMGEARDLRRQVSDATAAERIARDEAAGLRAELDARKQWGLWRRVRGC